MVRQKCSGIRRSYLEGGDVLVIGRGAVLIGMSERTTPQGVECRSMWQLLKKVRHFMETASPFPGGKHGQAKV